MDKQEIKIMVNRAVMLRSTEPDKCMSMLDQSMVEAAQQNDLTALILFEKANTYYALKQYKRAVSHYQESAAFYNELKNKQGQLSCLEKQSDIAFKLSDTLTALNLTLECLSINTASGNVRETAVNYASIGKIYFSLNENEKAIEYFLKSLKITEAIEAKEQMVLCWFFIGHVYLKEKNSAKAEYYLLRAQNNISFIVDSDIKARLTACIAMLHTQQNNFDLALSLYHEINTSMMTGVSAPVQCDIKCSLAKLYIELTQYDKAIQVLQQALKLESQAGRQQHIIALALLSLAHENVKDDAQAFYWYKKFHEADQQMRNDEMNLRVQGLHIKYDLDELKKQKEIAELSDKLKEQFLANVSHEIRTPMNGVLGMTHLLENTGLNEEQKEFVNAIRQSANNLMVIINDILDFSKINAGKIEFIEQDFTPRDVVKGVVQLLAVKANEKQLQLACTIDYQLPQMILGDAIRLNQILINLTGNAIKFTEKGKVHLDVKVISKDKEYCTLRFKVTDTGIGIPEEKLNTIFDSFEQAENNKRRYEGTGLGLTIVKQLVEMQGGHIYLNSKLNEGSEFTFELKYKMSTNDSEPNKSPIKKEKTKVKIDFENVRMLIAEDNKVNQLLVKNMLKKFGVQHLSLVESGQAAIDIVQKENFDMILMDIQMPGMDGYEATEQIQKILKEKNISTPILACTADASEKEKEKARNAGMIDYIVKPYTPDELYEVISKYVPGSNVVEEKNTQQNHTDLSFLDKFTGGDDALTIQLIEIFLKQVPEALASLEKNIPLKNWKEVFAVAHKTKSSISIFEFTELKNILLQIEECTKELVNLEDVPGLFSVFSNGCAPAIENLSSALDRLKATK